MPFMKKGRHACHEIKAARPRWLSLLVALGLFAALMPMSAAFADSPATVPWTEDTNDPTWWEAYGLDTHGEVWSCTKEDNEADVPGGYTLGEPPAGSEWRLLVVKAGSEFNDLFWDPTVGDTYSHTGQGGWSHVILCSVPVDLQLEVEKAWAGDEIDLEGVTVAFTIAVNDGAGTPGAGPVAVEEGDSVVITEDATGLPENCTYESDLADVSPYIVDAEDAEDGLITLTVTNTVDCVNVPQGALTVEKTAEGTFDRDHDWSILKSVDPAVVNLFIDGSGDATVTWDIDVTYEGFTDSNHEVTGTITITNGEPLFDARIDTVIDSLGEVDCDLPLPATLDAAGGALVCDYSLTGVTEDGTNEVDVTGELIDTEDATNVYPIDETDSADFSFVMDEETDETAVVSDLSDLGNLLGDAGYTLADLTLDADDYTADDVISFTYSTDFAYEDFGQEECGAHTYDNTATIMDDGVEEDSSASVDVNVQCLIFDGESATGYGTDWKLTKRAPNTWFMFTTWTDIVDGGADIIAGQFYDVGDVTGSRNGTTTLTFELDGDWELADVVGNVKINPMSCTTNQNYKQPGQFAPPSRSTPTIRDRSVCRVCRTTECYGIHLSVGQWVPDPNFPPDTL